MRTLSSFLLLLALAAGGCGGQAFTTASPASPGMHGDDGLTERLLADRRLSEEILRLDPDRISRDQVRDVLSRAPAPRVILLNGSLPVVSMVSVSRFLALMGYPESSLRSPVDGTYTRSSFQNSRRLAGTIAWYYERDGMMPIIIGHSQGGMLALKVLHELNGSFGGYPRVWSPFAKEPEDRYTIIDPLSGEETPVGDLRVGLVSAIAAGHFMRLILGQWEMLPRLRQVPDTVEEFSGYHIRNDILGGGIVGTGGRYTASGTALVNNMVLPSSYSHFTIPLIEGLARDEDMRQAIDAYHPDEATAWTDGLGDKKGERILFAADLWYRIKKHWCTALQRMIGAHGGV